MHAGPHGGAVLARKTHIAVEGAVRRKLGLHTFAQAGVVGFGRVQGARGAALQFACGVAQHHAGLAPHHVQHAVARYDDAHRRVVQNGLELPAQRGLVQLLLSALAHQPLKHPHQFADLAACAGPHQVLRRV
ncbi:hypothetical protein D3C87_1756640 [compost metagenome]